MTPIRDLRFQGVIRGSFFTYLVDRSGVLDGESPRSRSTCALAPTAQGGEGFAVAIVFNVLGREWISRRRNLS
jgi:hypothetical protein